MDVFERLSKSRLNLLFTHLIKGFSIFNVYRNWAFKLVRYCQVHKHHQISLIEQTIVLIKFVEGAEDVVIVMKFLEPLKQKFISNTFLMPLLLTRTHLQRVVIIRLGISNPIQINVLTRILLEKVRHQI